MSEIDYVTRVLNSPLEVSAAAWNALLTRESDPSPFMRHEYLTALHASGSACPPAGWQAQFVTLWRGDELHAACPMYLKNHSYGEYVFDWAWANAYAQHGLDYYPKALVAVPFTPVPGARLLARDDAARAALVQALVAHTREEGLSSLHLLFAQPQDLAACKAAGMMLRHTVQFHWMNEDPTGAPFVDFDHFLASLQQEKRKKIRQERRKVHDAGVAFRWSRGDDIASVDWDFFYRCYERTYLEHGNAPYLNRDFFQRMARSMPQHWLLFVAERGGRPIASSLIAIDDGARVAYGRYWGALERVDCLHFEACYYQPLDWCIAHGFSRFEGGAQGEHKMARALLPVKTSSVHWLAHPAFAEAVERFLQREGEGVGDYLEHLALRNPLKTATPES
ncbi:MAG: GNAT family N-acetyltransferase [Hydrogenophaga sp.]|uniref:GNAT family N-acetyltransferase n=1 Tax=Hydrogenophaga sp. TaxID=1904254 RepID=UPI00261C59CD|nr:GNAT family N-acetyltransferase [Hydrogenophaga sp.]MCV0437349.1 GNAT family N-acetyltransferase [Hydrogenophaga sp.]